MRKLIHSSFELDLSPFKISDTEENNWFSDSFFLKYSFPFEIDLEEDLDIAFGFISQYNSDQVETYFDLLYVHGNSIEKAVLEIESHQDKLSCVLRYGFEQLPSFEKKLSELSLEKITLDTGVTIYQHAETIITQTWPAVNYNFPQIHVDKYDVNDELWEHFGGVLNNRVSGDFLQNTVDTVNDITYNRNIIQPLPYILHVLQRGMIDAGYVLSGKILTDELIMKVSLYGDVDYFKKPNIQEPIDVYQVSVDAVETIPSTEYTTLNVSKYLFNTNLATTGKYNINGDIEIRCSNKVSTYFIIKYRNTIIYEFHNQRISNRTPLIIYYKNINIDLFFETIADLNINDISIESIGVQSVNRTIMDLSIALIRVNDAYGVATPSVINENKVDLTKAVSDITFGDFVKVVKNWFNYDLDVVGNLAIMNPIENEINYNDTEDLQFSEIKKPLRKFTQGASFLLKFQDIDNSNYTFLPVFQNKESIVNSGYKVDDKTTTIEINGLPLPLLTRNGAQTSYFTK